ncbi:MAG: DUF3160 domain-containing protein [Methanospirillaceae archaeon]|nr:DUF3160 domain-containing protein [Methanospirillaceae archaeon]
MHEIQIRQIIAVLVLASIIFVSGCACGTDTSPVQEGKMNTITGSLPLYEPMDVRASVPDKPLPYQSGSISNLKNVTSALSLSPEILAKIQKQGSVVVANPFYAYEQDIAAPYQNLKNNDIPIFVTSDTLLHLYHIQFDKTLRDLEERELYDQIWSLGNDLLTKNLRSYEKETGEMKEAAKRNAAFFSVGQKLLQPDPGQIQEEINLDNLFLLEEDADSPESFTIEEKEKYRFEIPVLVRDEVNAELSLITAHEGFFESPVFHYSEDYSQYVPRGHYTGSEKLKNYFLSMMWYGRMSFLLKGGPDGIVSEEDAQIQTCQALLISDLLHADPKLLQRWNRIYETTSFFVGTSDDLGPYEYRQAMQTVFQGPFASDQWSTEKYHEIKTEIAQFPSPQIYGGTGDCAVDPPFTLEDADACLEATKGFRFMGQRFIPDSYIFSELTGPYTGLFTGTGSPFTLVGSLRGFPMGLDAMALLGSNRAAEHVKTSDNAEYERYQQQVTNLSLELPSPDDPQWQKNLYWGWLFSLMPLFENPKEGYPAFMQTDAWLDKSLSTALASWAELRHDTILYAKQSYTLRATSAPFIPETKPVVGYVEPNPELYNRLLYLTSMTRTGLSSLDVLDESSEDRLVRLEAVLSRLVDISVRELANSELSKDDYEFIATFGDTLKDLLGDVDEKTTWTTMIADVHTDTNSRRVLEEGVGFVDLILVAYPVPDGRIILGAGPVLTYYEFTWPMSDRLTDEAWREMQRESPVEKPWWTSSFTL